MKEPLAVRACLALFVVSTTLLVAALPRPPSLQDAGRFDLVARDGDLRQVLALVSETGGLSVEMTADIHETITVRLADVTLEEALDRMLSPFGLKYTITGGSVRVERP